MKKSEIGHYFIIPAVLKIKIYIFGSSSAVA
jgi:hypothetical protein